MPFPSRMTRTRYIIVSTQGRGDEAALQAALAVEADYVAFVGSKRKAETLKAKLLDKGVDPARVAAIRSPAGLDLGAITPEEIALSVLAEIVAPPAQGSAAGAGLMDLLDLKLDIKASPPAGGSSRSPRSFSPPACRAGWASGRSSFSTSPASR